jgi:hypothetical protein
MLDKILLFILKQRLKRYKRDAKWYEKQGCYNNWYHENGIPNLEEQIKLLKFKISIK